MNASQLISTREQLTAVVLAGQRGATDPLAVHTNTPCKAVIEIGGKPMVLRVLSALKKAGRISSVVLSGPRADQLATYPAVAAFLQEQNVDWREPAGSPSTSAYAVMQSLPKDQPVLLTTADHPFLQAGIVDSFCADSLATGADVTVGLAPYPLVRAAFPEMKKTVLRFSDGEYCGCNLFSFLTPEGRRMADLWRQVENERKNPLKVIKLLGWWPLLRYRLGWLSLDSAVKILSRRFGVRCAAVVLEHGEAAVDVDSIDDYNIVQSRF